jgi:hypothetical protein
MSNEEQHGASIESRKDFAKTPKGQYKYYSEELGASAKMLNQWHKQADKITQKFLGKTPAGQNKDSLTNFKLNLFHSNTTTLASMLYGSIPKIDVSRRHADANDDIARVATTTLNRLLNLDVQDNGAEIDSVLRAVLQDRLLGGLGCARVRYEVETEVIKGVEEMTSESAPIEYYHWGDVSWSWARSWSEVRWVAFRSYLTKDEIEERFGAKAADKIQLKQQKMNTSDDSNRDTDTDGAWKKGEIWELWDKQKRKVVWLSIGYDKVLDIKDDTLGLNGFFPVPPFFIANATTALYMPTPDYKLAEDLYNEIDKLQERISIITEAVKVVGVYDSSSPDIQTMMNHGSDNKLIPVSNWAIFGEKNGLKGQIDWMPIGDIVNALDKLRELRSEAIGLLQQVTGMSDIMRGELGSAYEGVGQSQMKAKFGSIRVQALQDQFARFATDLFQIKAEIIAKHFSPETIAQRSNMQFSPDIDKLPQAIELIKNPAAARLRVEIRPESVAMVDYAQLKNERTEFLGALSNFMQSAQPLMESDPAAKPFLLQMLQWGLAGFKGASEIEGVLDRAIEAATQQAQQGEGEKPDPAMQAAQMAMQAEQQKQQGELGKIQAKAEADMRLREHDVQADLQTATSNHQMKLIEVNADMTRALTETDAKLQADLLLEQVQAQTNIQQTQATMEGEMQKDLFEAQINIEAEGVKTANKIREIGAAASAKITESQMTQKPEAKPKGGDDA